MVTVGKETGMGGRNQEYILAAALELGNTHHVVMASVDSDGTDGPGHQFVDDQEYAKIPVLTGGIVDSSTLLRAGEMGIDLAAALKRHDTSPALYAIGDAVVSVAGMSMGDLSVTLVLLPVGIPLILLARKMFSQAVLLLMPPKVAHPIKELGKSSKRKKDAAKDAGADVVKKARKMGRRHHKRRLRLT